MKKILLIPTALLLLCCCSNEDDLCMSVDTQYDDSLNSPECDPNAKMENAYWDTTFNHWVHYGPVIFINEYGDTVPSSDYL